MSRVADAYHGFVSLLKFVDRMEREEQQRLVDEEYQREVARARERDRQEMIASAGPRPMLPSDLFGPPNAYEVRLVYVNDDLQSAQWQYCNIYSAPISLVRRKKDGPEYPFVWRVDRICIAEDIGL